MCFNVSMCFTILEVYFPYCNYDHIKQQLGWKIPTTIFMVPGTDNERNLHDQRDI